MTTHSFTLIAEGPDLQEDRILDALHNAGCADALVGRADGVQYVDFDRDAGTLEDAVLSAIADLETIAGIDIVRLADAGLISMANIPTRTGRTRESVRLLITGERGPGGFPAPVTDPRSRYRLWRSDEVARWFRTQLATPDEQARDDHIRAAINAALELRRHRSFVSHEPATDLRSLLGI